VARWPLTPAFIVKELDDGRCVVLPSVPPPAVGALYILARERIHCRRFRSPR
jgi:hypothetical protein